jgi:hypothetical protein
MHVQPDGKHVPQVIVALTQTRQVEPGEDGTPGYLFRGGSTLVVDLSVRKVKYRVVKNVKSSARQARTAAFLRDAAADPLRGLFLGPDAREPFAVLHALADEGL